MNLKKYSTILLSVLAEHKTGKEVEAATCSNTPDEEREILEEYKKVAQEIRQAISRNKDLLGVFPEGLITHDEQEKILEKEIRKRDLFRHILKVRVDIKKSLGTEDIAKEILTDLSHKLEIQKLGGVFGKQEEKAYKKEFQPKEQASEQDPILEKLKERMKDPEYRAAMEKLRREGKIL